MTQGVPRHAAIVLAAGSSSRLGYPKQLYVLDGEALVRRATRAALATNPAAVLVVLGANADAVYAAVADLPVQRVDCSDWRAGMSATLRTAVLAVPQDCDGALVVLCDQHGLDAHHLQALVTEWQAGPARAVGSAYASVVGVPAVLPRAWFDAVLGLAGDRGARELLRSGADNVVTVSAPQLAFDLDRPGDEPGA